MNADYVDELKRRFLKETQYIRSFVARPENRALQLLYETSVAEIQLRIISNYDGQPFAQIVDYIFDLVTERDIVLRTNKRLVRAMLFYMYWNCDIGRSNDPETIEARPSGSNGSESVADPSTAAADATSRNL